MSIQRQSLDRRSVLTLRRWRWLILIAGLVVVLSIEISEHHFVWDRDFLGETVYGIAVPVISWLALTLLANQADLRAVAEAKTYWQWELDRNLEKYSEWSDLTRYVVSFPATFLPVDHVSLFVYDHTQAQLHFALEWNAFYSLESPRSHYRINFPPCQTCLTTRSIIVHPLNQCGFIATPMHPDGIKEYCHPLFYDGLLIGVQLLRCAPEKDLTLEQQKQLEASTAPIALALALALARRRQLDETRYQAESDERRRVATELHDSLGQMIGYLHLNLDRLANDERLQVFTDIQLDLTRMLQVADSAYEQIRGDLWILHSWQASDVTQIIADHVTTIAYQSGLDIQFRSEGEPACLEPKISYQVFSLVREGLNNIIAHAQAQHATVELIWTAEQLYLHLIDDGVGFEPTLSSLPGHYGLRMMGERVLALNGTLLIDSSPGRGARLSIVLPIGRTTLSSSNLIEAQAAQ